MESYRIESPTNVTLTILNTGSIAVNLASYTVRDSNGAQFDNTSWTGPLIDPNQNMTANILIDGKSFTFQPTSTYTIIVVTSRSNPFTFTIT